MNFKKHLHRIQNKQLCREFGLQCLGLVLFIVYSSELHSDTLRLTCLNVTDHSGVIKRASEKASPTGGPAGITHSSRMAGVNPQASPALCSIPHLPDMRNSHSVTASNKNWWLQHVTFSQCKHTSWRNPHEIYSICLRKNYYILTTQSNRWFLFLMI